MLRRLDDPDLLIGLSEIELNALSDGMQAVEHQGRLSTLLERNREPTLSASDAEELDRYLEQIDALNILKARARFTMKQLEKQIAIGD